MRVLFSIKKTGILNPACFCKKINNLAYASWRKFKKELKYT